MTRTNQKYRALFLAAIMVLSVMVGTVAFAGSAAATSVDTATATDLDPATSTTQVDFTVQGTLDATGANGLIKIDLTPLNNSGVDLSSITVSAPTDPNVEVTDTVWHSHNNTITANLTESGDDGQTGAIVLRAATIDSSSADTGDVDVTVTVRDTDAGTSDTAQATVSIDNAGPSIESARAFPNTDNGAAAIVAAGAAGDTIVELTFNETIVDAGPSATDFRVNLSDGTVVTPSAVQDAGTDDGQLYLVLDSGDVSNPLEVSEVNVSNAGFNDANGNTVEVAVNQGVELDGAASAALFEGGNFDASNKNVFEGEVVAFVADGLNDDFEINTLAGDFVFSGSTGTDAFVFLFDTTDRNRSATYEFTGADIADSQQLGLRDLGLSASAESTAITDADPLTGTIETNSGGRNIALTLYDSDDEEVATQTVTTGSSSGSVDFDFGTQSTGTYYVEAQDVLSGVTDSTADITVSEAAEGQAAFSQNTYSTFSGDVASITLSLDNADAATVTLGSQDSGYHVNVTVEDGDGDGEVTLLWNTYLAGGTADNHQDEFDVSDSDDEILNIDSSNAEPTSPVDSGSYDLDVRAGESVNADAQSVSVVAVEGRSTNGVSSWTAPEERSYSSVSDILAGVDNGNVTESDNIAVDDLAILAIDANGIEGVLDSQSQDNATADFLTAEVNSNIDLTIRQENPRQNRNRKFLNLDNGSLTVIPDADNETYYLVIDLGSVSVTQSGVSSPAIVDGDEYRANFTVLAESGFTSEESVYDTFSTANAEIDVDSDPVQVLADSGQTVSGTSSLAPGTTLRVQLQSTGDTSPRFIKTSQVLVDENGEWSADFDFSGQASGDTFSVQSSDTSRGLSASADGEVVDEIEDPDATPEPRTIIVDSPTPRVVTQEVTRTVVQERTVVNERTVVVTQTPGQPGFGIAVAILALLAAALLAVRRRD